MGREYGRALRGGGGGKGLAGWNAAQDKTGKSRVAWQRGEVVSQLC